MPVDIVRVRTDGNSVIVSLRYETEQARAAEAIELIGYDSVRSCLRG